MVCVVVARGSLDGLVSFVKERPEIQTIFSSSTLGKNSEKVSLTSAITLSSSEETQIPPMSSIDTVALAEFIM